MAFRSPARWLAPIALLAALAAVGLVYQSATEDTPSSSGSTSKNERKGDGKTSKSGRSTAARTTAADSPKTYRIKSGDTLGAISASTGVSIEELQELNPDLDASSLSVGQRIKLR
jgi:LysM repeat protein